MSGKAEAPSVTRPRYRKMSTQLWADARFRQLSAPRPNAQTLWIYLLLGPHGRNVPGLFVSGRASISEFLHWSKRGTDVAWREIEAQHLAEADWTTGVIWIPKAIKHNPPENPNVVKGWRNPLAEIPACPLKTTAVNSLREFCKGLGKGFAEAFPEGFGESVTVTVTVAVPGRLTRLRRDQPDDPAQYDPGRSTHPRRAASDGGPSAPASAPVGRPLTEAEELIQDARAFHEGHRK